MTELPETVTLEWIGRLVLEMRDELRAMNEEARQARERYEQQPRGIDDLFRNETAQPYSSVDAQESRDLVEEFLRLIKARQSRVPSMPS